MSEIEINGQQYLCGKLNARQQFHVVRRLAPIWEGLFGEGASPDKAIHALAMMADQEVDYILDRCLGVVRFRSAGGWAPLKAPNGSGQVMLEAADDLTTQLRLVFEVLRDNLQNFTLEGMLPTSPDEMMTIPTSTSSN